MSEECEQQLQQRQRRCSVQCGEEQRSEAVVVEILHVVRGEVRAQSVQRLEQQHAVAVR